MREAPTQGGAPLMMRALIRPGGISDRRRERQQGQRE